MKKKVFFMLFLAIAGIASVNAQMRIGGSEIPNPSAVLDLNPDDNVSVGNAALGLALPRVDLRNSHDAFPLLSHVKGMSVYNMVTAGDVNPGVYINNGTKWLRQLDCNTPFLTEEKDSIVGNEVVGATDGSLTRSGLGTTESPYTLAVSANGIGAAHLQNYSVTTNKIAENSITVDKLRNADNSSILYTDENSHWKVFTRSVASGEFFVPNNGLMTQCKLKLPDHFGPGLYGIQIICDSNLPEGNVRADLFRFITDRKPWGNGTGDVCLGELAHFEVTDSHTATGWLYGCKPVEVEFFCTNKGNKDLRFKIICSWLLPF